MAAQPPPPGAPTVPPAPTATVPPTTPPPTATSTPRTCKPPTLIEPINGATIINRVKLRWSFDRPLADDEWFDVRVERSDKPLISWAWTKQPTWEHDASGFYQQTYKWQIAVIRGHYDPDKGNVLDAELCVSAIGDFFFQP
jgi:hypothetical protein